MRSFIAFSLCTVYTTSKNKQALEIWQTLINIPGSQLLPQVKLLRLPYSRCIYPEMP